DTSLDDRWISLPNQPYKVRSALCAPLLSDSRILGVITLTHPERNHFKPPTPKLIAAMADQIALVLENVNFHLITRTLNSRLRQHQTFCRQMLATEIAGAVMVQNNRLVQVNSCAARLFGQAPEALLHLPSIASIIAYEDLERVRAALERCHTRPLSLKFGITHKSGQVIPVSAQGISLDFRDQPAVMMILNRVDAE
ncbi:MAG: GAF domain-containing protein, partial [Cyanobacteria bacterium P01_D01_bin.2]